jgi:hypothetical protein
MNDKYMCIVRNCLNVLFHFQLLFTHYSRPGLLVD